MKFDNNVIQSNSCHSDDRREEESRWHKVDVSEILRFALNDIVLFFIYIMLFHVYDK